jgi:hypothetical protein
MPPQDGAGRHQPVCPQRSGQVADQRGQHRAVGPVQPWSRLGAPDSRLICGTGNQTVRTTVPLTRHG